MRPKLTYANVMVTILAFVVLAGGAAYAASKLAKNSVGTKQLKNNSVTAAKIKNGAVTGSKVADASLGAADLNPSVLGEYAKRSELGTPYGNDAISPDPAAGLSGAIYNVGPTGVDCQGSNAKFPHAKIDDISFSTVDFDTAGLVHTEPGAAPNCYNGFEVSREGTYIVTAWIGWEGSPTEDDREILLRSFPLGKCCPILAIEQRNATGEEGPTSQPLSAIVRLQPGSKILIQGSQYSGEPLGFFNGAIQIAWLGP
jgi:hypothetical protein